MHVLLLRFTKEDDNNTQRVDYGEEPHSDQSSMRTCNGLPKAMKAHEDLLESLSSLVFRSGGFN